MRILVIEDDKKIAGFLEKGLTQSGYAVDVCHDGDEGLVMARSFSFDAAVFDRMLPGMDGLEIIRAIRQEGIQTPVLILSAKASVDDRIEGLQAGGDDYLTKPFNKWELLARVKNILQNRMARKDKESVNQPLSVDQEFMNRLQGIVSAELKSGLLSVSYLASELAMSERQLQRKIKAISGLSPQQLIKEVRLQKSRAMLMAKRVHTVAEAANLVGFDKTEYFSSQFTQRFGKRPSDLLKG